MTNALLAEPKVSGDLAPKPLAPKLRLQRIRDALSEGLIERDIPVRLALLAALAGEHLLLIGPPGTAKSELARRLKLAFTGQTYFERLLTPFSVPEELFGPLSIKSLEEDRYERQIDGFLPTASVAFLDEVFKANSAILNSLLTLLNEREFDNGTHRISTPLVSVVGASNELPAKEELLALYDRFLVRYHVDPVTDGGFGKLLDLRGNAQPTIDHELLLTPDDIRDVQAKAARVSVSADAVSMLKAMRKFCQNEQIPVSDRRWRKALFLLQVAAFTDGRHEVSVWDCWLLQHCVWHKPEERATVAKWYEDRAGAASPREPERFIKVAAAWEQRLKEDKGKKIQKADKKGRLIYLSESTGKEVVSKTSTKTVREGYNNREVTVPNDPVMGAMTYAPAHIRGRVTAVDAVHKEVSEFLGWSNQQIMKLAELIQNHLWLDPAFANPAVREFQQHIKKASEALRRLEAAKKGFEELPIEEELEIDGLQVDDELGSFDSPSREGLERAIAVHRPKLARLEESLGYREDECADFLLEVCKLLEPAGEPDPARQPTAQQDLGLDLLKALFDAWTQKGKALSDSEIAELFSECLSGGFPDLITD